MLSSIVAVAASAALVAGGAWGQALLSAECSALLPSQNCVVDAPHTCDVLTAYAAVADGCGGGGGHFLHTSAPFPGKAGSRYTCTNSLHNGVNSCLMIRNFTDGSARMVGTITSGTSSLDVNFFLVNRASSPIKDEVGCSNPNRSPYIDPTSWENWDFDPAQNSTLCSTPGTQYEGFCVSLRGVMNDHYGIHRGYGASNKNAFFGMSAWVSSIYLDVSPSYAGPDVSGLLTGPGRRLGDLNINLACACRCPCPNPTCTPPSNDCGNGIVETGEECDEGPYGGNCCTDNCTIAPQNTPCGNPVDGPCDVPEVCDGQTAQCPNDAVEPQGTPCGTPIGLCDVVDQTVCDGTNKRCPGPPPVFDTPWNQVYLSAFNAISFGGFTADTGDVEGRLAVRNNFSVGLGYSIGDKTCVDINATTLGAVTNLYQPFALVVGGDGYWGSGELYPNEIRNAAEPNRTCANPPEGAFVGGSATAADPTQQNSPFTTPMTVTDSCFGTPGCLDSAFDAAQAYFVALSDKWAALPATASYTVQYGGLFVTCNDPNATRNVLNVQASDISGITWWSIDGNSCLFESQWIVNIVGTGDVTLSGGDSGTVVERTIFNVPGAGRTVFVSGTQIPGNLLMPQATLNFTTGVILGNVVAGDVVWMNQINLPDCIAFLDVRLFVPLIGAQRRQSNPNEAYCAPNDVLFVAGHGSFRPGDVVTVGDGGNAEQATIQDLLTVGGRPAFRFTAALTNTHNPPAAVTASVPAHNRANDPVTVITVDTFCTSSPPPSEVSAAAPAAAAAAATLLGAAAVVA